MGTCNVDLINVKYAVCHSAGEAKKYYSVTQIFLVELVVTQM
jgi:hypothetical protein